VPIYEYECDQLGHRFEKWQSMQDEPIRTCPTCGAPVHKIMHAAGIIFKGSGWYVTDNRKSSGATESTGTYKTETKNDKAETKSEKAETKNEKAEAKSEKASAEAKGNTEKKDSSNQGG
jgi:putative FmdB family regulatory protein